MTPIPGALPDSTPWVDAQLAPVLVGIIALAATGTAVLFVLGVVAYRRRRSTRYLLLTVALGLLFVRSIVGLGTVHGLVPMAVHHLLEHGTDLLIAILVLYTVYRSAPVGTTETDASDHE